MACSGKCKLARIWNGIFAALDDQDAALVDIAWMPAHTAVTDVGVSTLSDGRTLTAHDRRGNEEADRLAKKAAAQHRVPEHIRRRMGVEMEIAKQLGRWIGQATAIAGDFTAPDVTVWRDSRHADRRLRVARVEVRQPRQTRAAALLPVPPQLRWASAVQGRTVDEASLRHNTHTHTHTGSSSPGALRGATAAAPMPRPEGEAWRGRAAAP